MGSTWPGAPGLELAENLAAAHLDRPDLGDGVGLRRAAGGLEVDDDERRGDQGCAEFIQGGLDGDDRRAHATLGRATDDGW